MEIKYLPVSSLKAWDKNPRKHDVDRIIRSIKEFGFRSPLVVNHTNDKYIIEAGHGRFQAAVKIGIKSLPCVVVEDDEKTAKAYAIADNRMADSEICNALGLEVDELIRLKYVTGFAKLFENAEYQQAWETRSMIKLRRNYVKGKK